MARKGQQEWEPPERKSGLYRAYDADGTVIWEHEDFQPGKTQIPIGISIAMKACLVTDADGEITHRWDPQGMFRKDRPSSSEKS